MMSLSKWLVMLFLVLAGVANAAGVLTPNNGQSAALSSDGRLSIWGLTSTTPQQRSANGNVPIVAVSQNAGFAVLNDRTVFDFNNWGPVAGLSSVSAVIEGSSIMTGPSPGWAVFARGNGLNGVKSFFTVPGMGGLQTFIGGGIGLSNVGVISLVPRSSNGMVMNSSWAWAIDTTGQLYDVQSTFNNTVYGYVAGVIGTCTPNPVPGMPPVVSVPPPYLFGPNMYGSPLPSCNDPYTGLPITTVTQAVWGIVAPPGISNIVTPITGMTNAVAALDGPNGNTFVARADGTVWAWGAGIDALGNFNPNVFGTPVAGVSGVSAVQVPGAANVISLATGDQSVYALTSTGTVYAWGNDNAGQLGTGFNGAGQQLTPVLVPGLTNIVSIHAAGQSVLALDFNGNVWAWGDNFYGQLGLGHNINVGTPTLIPGLTGVTSLSLAGNANTFMPSHVVTSKGDGSVWAWGDNTAGQLGNGTRVSSNVPVRVLGHNGISFLNVDPAILDVLVNGVSVMNNNTWNGFNFGNQAVGTTSAPQTMTFSNIGLISWTGFSFLPTGGDFAQTNTCGIVLLPGASCTISFTFTPTLSGLRTVPMIAGASLGNSNLGGGGGGPTLSGTGVAPQAVLSATLGFGTQKTTTTTTKVVTLTNSGNAVLTVGTPAVTGAGFALGAATATPCGATLAAGASCTLNLNFAPTLIQAYAGTLAFTGSNTPGVAPVMALSGTGAAMAGVRGDFDGNGTADIMWRDSITGQNALWFMNGTVLTSGAYAPTVVTAWSPVAISDFNGDGKADILWSNPTTGQNAVWMMNAQNIVTGSLLNSVATGWTVAGAGDFDGNGMAGDILWLNTQTRQLAIWLTNASGQITSAALVGSIPQGWSIAGIGDFDGNGTSDILWRNATTGANVLWLMNGTTIAAAASVLTVPSTWAITGTGDLNGDGKTDILWRDNNGNYAVWFMDGANITSAGYLPVAPPVAWTSVKLVDFNGDGKADILWRDTTGMTAVWLMNGLTITGSSVLGVVPTTLKVVDK